MYFPACSYFPLGLNHFLLPWEKLGDTPGTRWLKGPFPSSFPSLPTCSEAHQTQKNLLSNSGSSFLAFKENPPTCEWILLSRGGNLYFVSYRKWENFQPWN